MIINFYELCVPGFDTEGLAPAVWPGGESEALTRIEKHLGPDLSTVCNIYTLK